MGKNMCRNSILLGGIILCMFIKNRSNGSQARWFWSDFRAAAAAVSSLIIKPLHNALLWD
jgi:hypothetical protein